MATKFIATIKPTGGDYGSLNLCEAGLQNDLSLATILVFSISATSTPPIVAGTAVVGVTSGATGVCVLVNATQTQILIKTIAIASFLSGEIVKKSTDAAVNVTLSDAGDSPIIRMLYDGDWSGGADVTAAAVAGWTTSATNYIEVATSATCRHAGKWDITKQVLSAANATALNIQEEFVRIDGLQIEVNATSANNQFPVLITGILSGGSEFQISNCIIRGVASATYSYYVFNINDVDVITLKIWNTIFHHRGGTTAWADIALVLYTQNLYLGNVTVYGGWRGVYIGSLAVGTYYYRNVLVTNTGNADFMFTTGGPTYDVDYCASEDATADDKGGTHNRTDQTFSFIAASATDFHLMDSDKGAKWYGTSMVSDTNIPYSTDIDGETVGDRWNIGADGFPNVPEGTLATADVVIPEAELPIELVANIHNYIGLSTDTKPTDVLLNSKFTELNTGKKFIWTGETWVEDLTLIHAFSQTLFK